MRRRIVALAYVAVLALAVAACGGKSEPTASYDFGSRIKSSDTARMIEIRGTEMRFNPARVVIKRGDVATLRLINRGTVAHELMVGDAQMQRDHESEMTGGGMGHGSMDTAVVTADAGHTASMTWRFTKAGTVLFGCHQPGHYGAGMRGQIVVEP